MKAKAIIAGLLLLFVLGSVVYLVAKELWDTRESSQAQAPPNSGKDTTATSAPSAGAPARARPAAGEQATAVPVATGQPGAATRPAPRRAEESRRIIAYYFRSDVRCPSCLRIESWTHSAIEAYFTDAMKQGLLEWRVVNVDEPPNRHFVDDYGLYTKSVVLVETRDGKQTRWKNLSRIWELLGDSGAYHAYVSKEIASYLKGN
jgi:hypothetical protein